MKEALLIIVVSALTVFTVIKLTPLKSKKEKGYRKALLKNLFNTRDQ